MKSRLICPVCKQTLEKGEAAYFCENGHSFDIAKSGYVNLLLSQSGGGDNKEMVAARREFLKKGYYLPLAEALNGLCECDTLVDACCGEGYFTQFIEKNARESYAFDLSKDACKKAALLCNSTVFTANIASIPLCDGCADVLTHIFAPFGNDFLRVLKNDGKLIQVVPGKRHLWGLKKALYETPYENDEASNLPDTLRVEETLRVAGIIRVLAEDLPNLVKMTPYSYKTSPAAIEKLLLQTELETEIEFVVYVAKKNN